MTGIIRPAGVLTETPLLRPTACACAGPCQPHEDRELCLLPAIALMRMGEVRFPVCLTCLMLHTTPTGGGTING